MLIHTLGPFRFRMLPGMSSLEWFGGTLVLLLYQIRTRGKQDQTFLRSKDGGEG
jgi:hypothetical protein